MRTKFPDKKRCDPPRVLVVEDEASIRLLCKLELEEEGFEVRTARSSSEAQACVGDWTPNLVIADVRLGTESGLDLLRDIVTENADVRTVVYSGYGDEVRKSAWPADAVLVKSADTSALKRTVHHLLATGALRADAVARRVARANSAVPGASL